MKILKKKDEWQFSFKDKRTKHVYRGRIKHIHSSVIKHYSIPIVTELYNSKATKALSLVQGNNMSNFMFADVTAPMADGLARFLIKARTNLIYTSVKKSQIFHQGDGHCELWGQIGTLKHYLNYYRNKFTRFTERDDAMRRVICQAINLHCIQDVIRAATGNYIHWNKELKLPEEIIETK
jgi:hypothetical protein